MTNQKSSTPSHVRAVLRNAQLSSQKVNDLLRSVRRKPVLKVLAALSFSPTKVSVAVRKLLLSAIANAENTYGLSAENLLIDQAFVGKNFSLKRFVPRARGRSSVTQKPYTQVTIILASI
jgi:large subunit ribosomal protein L22